MIPQIRNYIRSVLKAVTEFHFQNKRSADMVVFKSIITLDLETTSLPQFDHKTTKITELAFIGCEVGHLNADHLPRVLHKLVLPFNPNKMIAPRGSEITGLTNELLMNVGSFTKEDVIVLKHFISRLPSPVCIVAHNGYVFDFPILQRAIKSVNMELPNNVYCFDSLKAFRNLLPEPKSGKVNWKSANETTPIHQKTRPYNIAARGNVCKDLFPEDKEQTSSQLTDYKFGSYKLRNIYYHFFNAYFDHAHSAESDAVALLCCIRRCKDFLNLMNEHSVTFNSVEPLQ